MRTQFYVTDWAPNGTQTIVIQDKQGKIHYIEEGCFGLNTSGKRMHCIVEAYGIEPLEVFRVSLKSILQHIACSPVSDGSEVLNELRKAIGK